jgi:starch synthase
MVHFDVLDSSPNKKRLRIVVTSSEAVPFSKTGGLGDVAPALCKALAQSGHDVTLFVPYHRQTASVKNGDCPAIHDSGTRFSVPVGERMVEGAVYWSTLPNSSVRVLLIDQRDYFNRSNLYQHDGQDCADNCERFTFFSRAVLECCRRLVLRPDVIHVNDWQSALIPALLEIERRDCPAFQNTGSVLTIHNLAFQGIFDRASMPLTGLDWRYFNLQQMEAWGQLNLLKTGIAFANRLTTVSPTYANEIQTKDVGCGLDGALRTRAEHLTGILNGIDTDVWNPKTDQHLKVNYDVDSFATLKLECKASLQQRMGLPVRNDVPLFSVISRMTDQKGFDLIAASADEMLQHDIQLVVLGTGESRYESMFEELSAKYPDKVAAMIGFDEPLAHQIEAGSDVFLMPSRFEPCGLNQLYSLAYGTIPLVRSVGGLADSVVDSTPEAVANGDATGLAFAEYNGQEFFKTFKRSLNLYNDATTRGQIIRRGMQQDSSWASSAQKYVAVYQDAMTSTRKVRG